jgi:hypothetical protein
VHRFVNAVAALGAAVVASTGVVTAATSYEVVALHGTSAAATTPRATVLQTGDRSAHVVHTTPASKAVARPRTTAKPPVRKTASVRRRTTHHVSTPTPSGPTSWGALNAAIARIPTYHAGDARWVVKNTGWWGTAIWESGLIYISPTVPESKLYDVAVHEWSHILTVRDYGGNVAAAVAATTAYYGGSDLYGAEYAADCMAILQGADWTNYTSCTSSRWRAGAQQLIEGHRLPGVSAG